MRISYVISAAAFVVLFPIIVLSQKIIEPGSINATVDRIESSLIASASNNSQKGFSYLKQLISISLEGATVGQAVSQISKKVDVAFSYDSEILPGSKLLYARVDSAPLQFALSEIFDPANIVWLPMKNGLIVLLKRSDPPHDVATFTGTVSDARVEEPPTDVGTISGTVSDVRTGDPIIGANVLLEGTRLGAATDLAGKFRIENVPVGTYTIEVHYLGYSPSTQEVTVKAGQTVSVEFKLTPGALNLREVVVTGTGLPTEKRELGNQISTISAQELQYSGATGVDQELAGKIPGALVNENSGAPDGGMSVRLRGISTVLGSSDPLYEVDGVIVNNSSPVLIDLGGGAENRLADLDPSDVSSVEVVQGAAAAALYGSLANNGVVQILTKEGEPGPPRVTLTLSANLNVVRKTLPVNMYPYNLPIGDSAKVPVQRYDWQNDIFRHAVGTGDHLDISGGSEDTRYSISTSYLGNQGILRGEDYQRENISVGLDQNLATWLRISVNAMYSNSNADDLPNGGLTSSWGVLTGFLFGPNTFNPEPVNGVFPHQSALVNPVEAIDLYKFQQQVSRLIGSARLFADPIEGLNISYTLGYDTYTQLASAFIPIGTSFTSDANGFAQQADLGFFHLENDLSVSYRTAITPSLASTTVIGGQLLYEKSSTFSGTGTLLAPIAEIVPAGATQTMSEFISEYALYGIFGQETVGILDRLFLTAAGRLDASSVFGANNRVQLYPKLSADYLLSGEDFWKNSNLSSYVPTFKLRAAFGESGGLTAIGPYNRFTLYNPVSYSNIAGLVPSTQLGASNIEPEREQEVEAGTDMSFLSDRVGLEFTYYQRSTTHLLLTATTSPSIGYTSGLENIGTLDDWGTELLLRTIPINGYVRWISTVTFSTDHNEIKNVPGGIVLITQGFGIAAAVNGQPFPVFYGSAFQRDANGNIVHVNGIPQRATQSQVIGNPNPSWMGSFINEIQIGPDWYVSAQLDAVVGQDIFNFTDRVGDYPAYGTLAQYQQELEGKLPAGYNAAVFNIFENWVENGSYVELRQLSVTRTLYPKFLGISSLAVSLIGRNLFCFTKYDGYDPEVNVGGQRTGVRGFDFVEVPIPITVTMEFAFHF